MIQLIPELVESLLVCLKQVSQVDVEGVGCVPVLQFMEVGIVCESHDVQIGLAVLCVILVAWLSGTSRSEGLLFEGHSGQIHNCPAYKRQTIFMSHPLGVAVQGSVLYHWSPTFYHRGSLGVT